MSIARDVEVLYRHVLKDLTQAEEMQRRQRLQALRKEASELEERLFRTDEAFVEERISADSYKRLKRKYQQAIQRVRVEQAELEEAGEGFAEKLRFTVSLLSNLGKVYQRAPFEGKHALVGSVFPDKLIYLEGSFRTSPESEIIALISSKTQKIKDTSTLSGDGVLVGSPGRTMACLGAAGVAWKMAASRPKPLFGAHRVWSRLGCSGAAA